MTTSLLPHRPKRDGTDRLQQLSRQQRRMIKGAEQAARARGDWGPWDHLSYPDGVPGGAGWTRYVRAAHRNRAFVVLERPLPDGTVHLAITSATQTRPTWWEGQRLKNELCGEDRTAVEVYPPQGEVVDGADMYHLWVLPGALPFSLRNQR